MTFVLTLNLSFQSKSRVNALQDTINILQDTRPFVTTIDAVIVAACKMDYMQVHSVGHHQSIPFVPLSRRAAACASFIRMFNA